ncbi:tannase/feruloyl esterase family alpha/beta hydrolase [Saccharothrix variisporea]|uniref:tannase/feruloyl esterase family alpha/beta hydrolase n=1 Tax=Saccharothrix variisporea TaxID=543527 RepID=UPI000EB20529|nr:tannase/feruloyl esterase family alpha/beta hydrolase [Saccharothrix variisporea]
MFAVVALVASLSVATASAARAGTVAPVVECADLVHDFAVPGTRVHVTSAQLAEDGEVAHCAVLGYVEPKVRFHLKLPTTTYTGRYLQYGCGGFCGALAAPPFPSCGAEVGGLAVAATDDGHASDAPVPSLDGTWAAADQAARDDLAFRAPHVVSMAAKRIIEEFYGDPPSFSYFGGCSNGGREALLLAQRYPHDFDGIIAGAPVNAMSALLLHQAWLARATTGPDGRPVLTADRLPALHDAVLRHCDHLDGLVDGQLDDPRRCDHDPAALLCPPGEDRPTCLTPAQVEAARRVYAGPTDAHGNRLYPAGQERGSELGWAGWIVPVPEFGGASVAALLADHYLKYLAYPLGTPHSSLADVRFTVGEFARLGAEGARGNAMSLDLGEFRRAGGRLILWHGWSDQGVPPRGLLDYYARLARHDDGDVRRWARVFMVPGLQHCGGGTGLTEFDPVHALLAWVEHGAAPDRIIATGRDAAGNVVRTRPVFPYPLTARYTGTGSTDDAANFRPVPPTHPTRDVVDWVGSYLHHKPGPVAP